MNEQAQQALNDALVRIINGATTATEFIIAETPDVIQQLLAWKMAESIAGWLLSAVVLLVLIKVGKYLKRMWDNDPYSDTFMVASGCYVVVSFLWAMTSLLALNLTWLQIWIAPKVYLIEYAAQLVK